MRDVNCPYCNAENDICHEDGYGCEEDTVHQQKCDGCGKDFGYNTTILFCYDSFDVPCFNGGEHNLEKIDGHPEEYFVGKKRCSYCDEIIMIDEKANQKALESYYKKIKMDVCLKKETKCKNQN